LCGVGDEGQGLLSKGGAVQRCAAQQSVRCSRWCVAWPRSRRLLQFTIHPAQPAHCPALPDGPNPPSKNSRSRRCRRRGPGRPGMRSLPRIPPRQHPPGPGPPGRCRRRSRRHRFWGPPRLRHRQQGLLHAARGGDCGRHRARHGAGRSRRALVAGLGRMGCAARDAIGRAGVGGRRRASGGDSRAGHALARRRPLTWRHVAVIWDRVAVILVHGRFAVIEGRRNAPCVSRDQGGGACRVTRGRALAPSAGRQGEHHEGAASHYAAHAVF
jgi:hypothetical protein